MILIAPRGFRKSKDRKRQHEVISMVPMKGESGNLERKFICHTLNANMYPAKDRSGCLNEIEEAHLGKLLTKIKKGK